MNVAFLEELMAIKDDNAALKAKVTEVTGKEVDVKPYVEKAPLSATEQIAYVLKHGSAKTNSKKPAKKNNATPKESPADKFCKALIKLAGKYKESKPLFQYIDVQEEKQVWTNGHIALKMLDNFKALDEIKNKENSYPKVADVMKKVYKPEGETLEITRAEITELVKGKEATDAVDLAGAKMVVSALRQLNALFPKITFYVATKSNTPLSFKTDYCEGLVTPAITKK